MEKRFLTILILAALFFCTIGVMGDDSGGGFANSSDSSDNSADDRTDNRIDTSPTRDDRNDERSGTGDSSGDSMDAGVKTPGGNGTGADNSPEAAERETETGIEHGLATIMKDESRLLSASDLSPGDGVASADPRAEPVIVTRSLVSLSSIPGTGPARMSELAKTVDDSYGHLSEAERSIRERSGIVTFFFGGEDGAADDIETHVDEDRAALDEMERMANDPSASPALKAFTQARLRIIRADLEHWQEMAVTEKAKSGLFG